MMTTLVDMVVQRVREDIFRGDFSPGEHLKQCVLAKHYGMSIVPVRQALLLLLAEGLIEHPAYRGARVTLLDRGEAIELADIRNALDTVAHQLALSDLDDHALSDLHKIAVEIQATYSHSWDSHMESIHLYYTVLLSQSNRPLLLNQVHATLQRVARYYAEFMHTGCKLSTLLPDPAMVAALRQGDKSALAARLQSWHAAHLVFIEVRFRS